VSAGRTDGVAPRVAVVTGASRGIGAAVVLRLVAAGMVVVATDRDLDGAHSDAGPEVSRRTLDVRDRAAVERAAADVEERFDRLDVLVNNAGIFHQTPALRMDEQAMLRILDVNLCGALRCTAAFGAVMARHGGGRIINMASVSGLGGAALGSAYAASKAGLIAATRSAARELASSHIVVNAVAPGYCETAMLDPQRALVERFVVPRIPLKRVATAEDVAEAVAFLATSEGTYMTGSVLTLDGGMTSG